MRDLLTTDEVALRLDVHPETVRRWADPDKTPFKDRLPRVKKGRRYTRFRASDVDSWKARHQR